MEFKGVVCGSIKNTTDNEEKENIMLPYSASC
jgi:hypothetical protein